MKKLLLVALLLLAPVCPLNGQATTGFHRMWQVLARGQSGVTAQIVPYATVTVTNTSTGSAATIYSDPLLTNQISPPVVIADAGGNYDYYISLNYCVNEDVSSPGQGSITNTNVCNLGGGSVSTSGTPVSGNIAAFSGPAVIGPATNTQINSLIQTLTNCTTPGYVYAPQVAACVAQTGSYPGANTIAVGNSGNNGWRTPLYTDITALWASGSCSGYLKSDGTCVSSAGVTSINGTAGAYTFSGTAVSCVGTTCTFTGAGSGIGSISWTLPSWLTASPTTISSSGTQQFNPTTGQTSHQVIGTCGSGTTFAPCALVFSDLPATVAATSQLPNSLSNVAHKWINSYTASTETFTQTQPTSTDLTDISSLTGLLYANNGSATTAATAAQAATLIQGLTGCNTSGYVFTPQASDCVAGGSGLSGMTAAQVPIAATASTVTSSKALSGSGAGITTGPASGVTSLDLTEFTGTGGQIADTGVLVTSALRSNIAFGFVGTPGTSAVLGSYAPPTGETITVPSGCTNSVAYTLAAPTGSADVYTINKCTAGEGTCSSVGSVSIAVTTGTATFTCSSSFAIAGGQTINITGPSSPTGTNPIFTIAGTHN